MDEKTERQFQQWLTTQEKERKERETWKGIEAALFIVSVLIVWRLGVHFGFL